MLFRWLVGYPVSLFIMPSQVSLAKDDPDLLKARERKIINHVPFTIKSVVSTHQSTISFCEAAHHPHMMVKDQKIIIHAVGNGDCFENHMNEYAALALDRPKDRIVGFNFRGTMASTGRAWSEDHWIDDVKSIIKHYQDQGVPLENILLHGHSLGGAIVTVAAARLYEEAKKKALKDGTDPKAVKSVKLLNNRSFTSLTDFIVKSVLKSAGSALLAGIIYGSLIGLIIGASLITSSVLAATLLISLNFITPKISFSLIQPIIKGLMWLMFGTLDALKAYQSLPQDCVDHIVAKNDNVIKEEVGMHQGLQPDNKIKKDRCRKIILENHDAKKKAEALRELLNIKDSKITLSEEPFDGIRAHNESLFFMHTYHKARGHSANPQISGQEVLMQKLNRLMK